MIQTGIKLKTVVDYLKDYLSIIIIIPAFIGGVWQSIELMSISMPYIRFFSISQIIPDGILIILFVIIATAFSFLGWFGDTLFFVKDKPMPPEYLESRDYEIYRKKQLRNSLILFIIIYIGFLFYFIYFLNDKPSFYSFKSDIAFTFLGIFWLNGLLNRCFFYATEKYKEIFKACNFFLLGLYIIIALSFSKRIHHIFIAPNNIVNIDHIKSDVKIKFPNTKQELLYFNDKFIFIKLIDIPKKDKKRKKQKQKEDKIYIMELNRLFENSKD